MYLREGKIVNRSKHRSKKKGKKYVVTTLVFIVSILLIGILYEKIGESKDAKKYSSLGTVVNVNNHKINIFTDGKGDSTVVFVGGLNEPSAYSDFYPLYSEISKHSKIVVYDKPGHGWSEITDTTRDIDSIVTEMHTALLESGQKSPYILVGHSLASLTTIRFAQKYKDEVKGIVLIDGGSPEYYSENKVGVSTINGLMYRGLRTFGIARFAINNTSYSSKIIAKQNNLKFLPDDLKGLYYAMTLKTMYNKNIIDEGNSSIDSAKKILSDGNIGNIPLRILTSESNTLEIQGWEDSQIAFKNWSTNSKQMVVKGSRHSIHQFSPEIINDEILKLIKN